MAIFARYETLRFVFNRFQPSYFKTVWIEVNGFAKPHQYLHVDSGTLVFKPQRRKALDIGSVCRFIDWLATSINITNLDRHKKYIPSYREWKAVEEKIMKRKIAATLSLLSLSLVMMTLAMTAARAIDGTQFRWIEPDYSGEDPSLSGNPTVIGYKEGTNWNFTMSWTNSYDVVINITAIRIYFSWGKNYTNTFSTPMMVDKGETKTFTMYNMTPPVTETSELWSHSYSVFIHHVNSTTAPYAEVPSTLRLPSPINPFSGSGFVVLSEDHLACLELWAKLNGIFTPIVGGGTAMINAVQGLPTDIAEVQVLYQKAFMEFDLGTRILDTGVYGQAKTHLQNADDLYGQALDAWNEKGTAMEDADLNYTKSETAYNYALASAANINAYGWLLFGLGWTFIGLGVIIYGLRKPKTASS
jgi:hypothetical protein